MKCIADVVMVCRAYEELGEHAKENLLDAVENTIDPEVWYQGSTRKIRRFLKLVTEFKPGFEPEARSIVEDAEATDEAIRKFNQATRQIRAEAV